MANELYRAWPDCESQMGALTLLAVLTQLLSWLLNSLWPPAPSAPPPLAEASFKPLISLPCARYELHRD